MDVFNLLSYINKVSLFAFFITTLVVGYQIYILKKEKSREKAPKIPDFKEKNNFNVAANFTSLPSSLTKKELKTVNYSKSIFLIISLLTIIVVVFIVSLVRKNISTQNQALIVLPTVVPQVPTAKPIIPTTKAVLSPLPTISLLPSPTVTSAQIQPTFVASPTIVPTEIILAQAPSSTPTLNPTNGQKITDSVPKVLPETGSWKKGFLIIGVAISAILFSFWF
ncbi:MAG: hypothetical protein AAB441_02260 [Patescibacteria group bacterium]